MNDTDSQLVGRGSADTVNAAGFTSQITAGFRAVELQHIENPIIIDPLAPYLAGERGFEIALQDWQDLAAQQGPGRHLRVPARNKIIDDALCSALAQLVQQHSSMQEAASTTVQVVNVGCGMDSKPWRLQLPATCSNLEICWFDVDQPGVLQQKQQLLRQAGAATCLHQQQQQLADSSNSTGSADSHIFPLLVSSYTPVPADLSETTLAEVLPAAGFDCHCSTVWIAEALIYYIPLPQAAKLLSAMRRLSPPHLVKGGSIAIGSSSSDSNRFVHRTGRSGSSSSNCNAGSSGSSKLIATCIDKELYSNHLQLSKKHYFSDLWHFSMDDLMLPNHNNSGIDNASLHQDYVSAGTAGDRCQKTVMRQAGWQLNGQPLTSAQLAKERYAKETYVAVYGGAECCFTADPIEGVVSAVERLSDT